MLLEAQIVQDGLPPPWTESLFHPKRKWRFDFCWPEIKLAVEVEGGTWSGGRHNTGKGFEDDCEKYAEAALLGWTVLRVTGKMIKGPDQKALSYTRQLYKLKTES